MAKKAGTLKKLFAKKCYGCSKALPKNKSGLQHWVQTKYGWKLVCASCKNMFGGRSTKPLFNKGGWGH